MSQAEAQELRELVGQYQAHDRRLQHPHLEMCGRCHDLYRALQDAGYARPEAALRTADLLERVEALETAGARADNILRRAQDFADLVTPAQQAATREHIERARRALEAKPHA